MKLLDKWDQATSKLSSEQHKVNSSQENDPYGSVENGNSSSEKTESHKQVSKPTSSNGFQITVSEGEAVTLLLKDKTFVLKPVGDSIQVSYK